MNNGYANELDGGALEPRALLQHPSQFLPFFLGILARPLPRRSVHVVRPVRLGVVLERGLREQLELIVCVERLDPAQPPSPSGTCSRTFR